VASADGRARHSRPIDGDATTPRPWRVKVSPSHLALYVGLLPGSSSTDASRPEQSSGRRKPRGPRADVTRLETVTKTPIVILRDPDNRLNLPIWIGLVEATAMATELLGIRMARPMTHDLLRTLIGERPSAASRGSSRRPRSASSPSSTGRVAGAPGGRRGSRGGLRRVSGDVTCDRLPPGASARRSRSRQRGDR